MASFLKKAAASVYQLVSDGRNFMYEAEILDSVHVDCAVISVGNLTMGGTGKTPVVQWVLDQCLSKGKRCAVVGRNYKARRTGISKVDPNQTFAAYEFGDEPTMIASHYPEVPVYVGSRKWEVALLAQRESSPDVILVDDGFQHRALKRSLDLVLIDATSAHLDYEMFPLGRSRETWKSLARADWIFLTKSNFVDELKLEEWYRLLPEQTRILELSYRLKEDFLNEAGKKAIAFTGLARPESFKQSLLNDGLYDVRSFVEFPDHHQYTTQDLLQIVKKLQAEDAEVILTTEKDWIKVKNLDIPRELFRPLGLEVHAIGPVEEFHAALDKVFSSFS
jgi:tetraacyldisaccharide 4'-kinase